MQCEVSLTELYEGQAESPLILGMLRDACFSLVRTGALFGGSWHRDALQLDVLVGVLLR